MSEKSKTKSQVIRRVHAALRAGGYVRRKTGLSKLKYDSWLWHYKDGITIDVITARNTSIAKGKEATESAARILADAGLVVETGMSTTIYVTFSQNISTEQE